MLALFDDHLPAWLLPAELRAWADGIADLLPPSSGGGLEYHPAAIPARTDVLVRLMGEDGSRGLLSGPDGTPHADPALAARPGWAQIIRFIRHWADPGSALHTHLRNVWLEFDFERRPAGAQVPSVFFDVDPARRLANDGRVQVAGQALSLLGHHAGAAALRRIAARLAERPLPHRLHYVGLMLGRPNRPVRLCLAGLDPPGIERALAVLNWPGNWHGLREILSRYCTHADRIVFGVDVHPQLQPAIGVEVHADRPDDMASLLGTLVEDGLLPVPDAPRLTAWPGEERLPGGELRRRLSGVVGHDVEWLIRRINHVKVSSDADGRLNAKVYLYLAYW